jgi:hypothetical protein
MREKREAFSQWLQKKHRDCREEYKRKRRESRSVIADCIKEVNMRWDERVTSDFKKSKKMFWKTVNRRRKPQEKLEVVVKDAKGEILDKNKQVVER